MQVTADFKKKLHEWEQMKGGGAVGGGLTVPIQQQDPYSSSDGGQTPSPKPTSPTDKIVVEGGKPPPLQLRPFYPDSPEEHSPVDKVSDVSLDDASTSVTEESLTKSNIAR